MRKGFLAPLIYGERTKKLIEEGLAYILGRDNSFRPIFIINLKKLYYSVYNGRIAKDLLRILIFKYLNYSEEKLFVQGRVESWVIIVDCQGLDFIQIKYVQLYFLVAIVNFFQICKMIKKAMQDSLFQETRVYKLYLYNMKKSIRLLNSIGFKLISKFLTKRAVFMDKKNPKRILEHVYKSQLEVKFGGECPDYKGEYWPPRVPSLIVEPMNANEYIKEKEYFQDFLNNGVDSMNLNDEIINQHMNIQDRCPSLIASFRSQFERIKKKGAIKLNKTQGTKTKDLLAWFDELSSKDASGPMVMNKRLDGNKQ